VLASVLAGCGTSPSPDAAAVTAVVARARQVADDATVLPVQVDGRWALTGPGDWLQPTISASSAPWYWDYPCARIDSSLVPGIRAFMTGAIDQTFASGEARHLQAALADSLTHKAAPTCTTADPQVAEGPLGPIRDTTTVQQVTVTGDTATAAGQVHLTDWQSGVDDTPAPDGGRHVGWDEVHNVLDTTYVLARGTDGRWRITSMSSQFAPGSGP